MGISTDAHCFACGYDTFLMLGGGMDLQRSRSRPSRNEKRPMTAMTEGRAVAKASADYYAQQSVMSDPATTAPCSRD